MRKIKTLLRSLGLALFAFMLISPSMAAAFSAYGAGTSGSPYRISTCAQLQEMQDDLAGYYKLVANIDCTGVAFTSVGTQSTSQPFTGTLDGQNHTIVNLNIANGRGLFGFTTGANLISIKIGPGTLTGNSTMGSFVGYASNTTLENVHSSMTIDPLAPGGGSAMGGLVGVSIDATLIRESSYSGTISGNSYIGGLIGYQGDFPTATADEIHNSSFNGTLNVSNNGAYAGGAIGILYSGTIRNSYSSGTINVTGTYAYLGGLIGISYKGATNNNFAASYINGTGTNFGAVFGIFYASGSPFTSTRSNNYFDRYRSNGNDMHSLNCAGLDEGSGNCTGVNTANATPSYFKNNSTNPPFNDVSWEFGGNWFLNSSYPTISLIGGFDDPTVPNSGDANGDGTADSYQGYVASVPNGNNIWSTIEVPSSGGCTLDSPRWVNSANYANDTGFTRQLTTMTAFDIYCKTPGSTVPVTIIYDKLYDTSSSVLRHFNLNSQTYRTVTGAVFGTRTVGGVVKTTVTYNITDGGVYDTDGLSNGVIIDPVDFSIPPATPNTGLESQDTSPIIAFMIVGALLVATGFYGQKRNR